MIKNHIHLLLRINGSLLNKGLGALFPAPRSFDLKHARLKPRPAASRRLHHAPSPRWSHSAWVPRLSPASSPFSCAQPSRHSLFLCCPCAGDAAVGYLAKPRPRPLLRASLARLRRSPAAARHGASPGWFHLVPLHPQRGPSTTELLHYLPLPPTLRSPGQRPDFALSRLAAARPSSSLRCLTPRLRPLSSCSSSSRRYYFFT